MNCASTSKLVYTNKHELEQSKRITMKLNQRIDRAKRANDYEAFRTIATSECPEVLAAKDLLLEKCQGRLEVLGKAQDKLRFWRKSASILFFTLLGMSIALGVMLKQRFF